MRRFVFQNFLPLPKLWRRCAKLRSAGTRHLVDLYCGVGFFGFSWRLQWRTFVGVEYDAQAIKAARRMGGARVDQWRFIGGGGCRFAGKLAPEATAVLLPPRKGITKSNLEHLRELRPAQIVYVSCHPPRWRGTNAFVPRVSLNWCV